MVQQEIMCRVESFFGLIFIELLWNFVFRISGQFVRQNQAILRNQED
jgi:hypothetical protein